MTASTYKRLALAEEELDRLALALRCYETDFRYLAKRLRAAKLLIAIDAEHQEDCCWIADKAWDCNCGGVDRALDDVEKRLEKWGVTL